MSITNLPKSIIQRLFVRRGLRPVSPVLAVIGVVAVSLLTLQPASAATAFTTSQWDAALAKVINADVAQSVTLPNGKTLWVFGDTTQVNGTSTVGAYGYPHDAFVTQQANSLNFTPVAGKYGYGWQQVPNWSDGTYFWMGAPVVDNGTLYVFGQRISGASNFSVVGSYVALFNASTLAFQKIVSVPGGSDGTTGWGGIGKDSAGWWLQGSHNVPCSYATDCKVGDAAWVPFGHLADPTAWQLHYNNVPATLNAGTTIGLYATSTGWDTFTKTGDAYGGTTIERLHASCMTCDWSQTGSWDAPSPSGTVTYGVAVHPEQAAPAGQLLVSYNVNGVSSAYHPLFEYLPK
jgi:hypothetical protein